MEKQNENMRDRLLAALPQPENLATYREETAALLARHARALRWDKIGARLFIWTAVALFWWSVYPGHLGPTAVHSFQFGSALMCFAAVMGGLEYWIKASQVNTLKEIKQVQLQILELQASLNKRGGN